MPLPDGLLDATKNYLNITWEDPALDESLTGILARGMSALNGAAGAALNYSVEEKPRELLLEYARYARSEALDEFQNNFLSDLLTLQIRQELDQYTPAETS